MRARSLFFALAALSVFAACDPKEDNPEVKASLTVSGAKDNTIAVVDAGKTVKLTVKSNVSWTASCENDWVTIDPISYENTDNKEVSTKVSLVVAANTGEERSTEVKFGAEGVETIVIKVNQSAATVEEKSLCVWNMETYAPYENPSVSTDFAAQEFSFVVHSNVDWTVTTSEWITVEPTSNKFDGKTENVTVKAVLTANDGDVAREGEIKFVGEGVADLIIPVKQTNTAKVNVTLVETQHPYCDVDFKVVPDEGITWTASTFSDENIAYLAENGLTPGDYLVYLLNYYLSKNHTVSSIEAALLKSGEDEVNLTGLDANTHYQFTAVGAVYNETYKQFVATTLPTDVEFTTTAAPAAESDYTSLLGTYSVNVTNVFADEGEDPAHVLSFTISEQYVNETYYMTFPNDDFSPVDGDYVDSFILGYDSSKKQIVLPNVQVGSEWFTWNFSEPVGSNAGIVFYAEVGGEYDAQGNVIEKPDVPEYLYYNWSSDYGKLTLASPDLNGKNLHWSGLICKVSDGKLAPTGYSYASYTFESSTDITRTTAAASVNTIKVKQDLMHPEFPNKKVSSLFCR